jgi:hypothetical protein
VTKAVSRAAVENHHLGAPPADLLQTVSGLVHVAEYLDAMRGQL